MNSDVDISERLKTFPTPTVIRVTRCINKMLSSPTATAFIFEIAKKILKST